MGLKIAVGGIEHETNTYRDGEAQLQDFTISLGESLIARHTGVRSYTGGMLDAAVALGAEVVPTVHAVSEPAGVIAKDTYQVLVEELLQGVQAAIPLDAVALALHGAGVARGVENIEVDICRRVREIVGPDVKIVITLDLHGNVSQDLFDIVDGAFGVQHSPHIDMFERGQDAIRIIPELIEGKTSPKLHLEKLPLLLAPVTSFSGPAATVNELCRAIEAEPGMIACTFFHGFPYADVAAAGASVLAIADGDPQKAKSAAEKVSQLAWSLREDFRPKIISPNEAIEAALASGNFPVAVLDGADVAGGGCPTDGTYLLRAMVEATLTDVCFAAICDPEFVQVAHEAGVGSSIRFPLGGKADGKHGSPITEDAYVKVLTDGRFLRQSIQGKGMVENVGKTARVQIHGVDVVVVSERYQPFDPEIFLLHGIDVSRQKLIGLKSQNHWRGGFADVIKNDVLADSPGLMSSDLRRFSHSLAPRPIWPLDDDVIYSVGLSSLRGPAT